jgi:hypothetical protein
MKSLFKTLLSFWIFTTVAQSQSVLLNPTSNQTVTQPPGTALSVNSLNAKGVINGQVSVTAYGAQCIGSSHNDASAIQQAVDAAIAGGGGTILIPSGNCYLGNPATTINLVGTGWNGGGLTLKGTSIGSSMISGANGPLIMVSNASSIEDMTVSESSPSNPLATPSVPSGTAASSSGTMPAGTYYACVAAVNQNWTWQNDSDKSDWYTTPCSNWSSGVTVSANGTITWTWSAISPTTENQVQGYILYVENGPPGYPGNPPYYTLGWKSPLITSTSLTETSWSVPTGEAPPTINYTQTVGIALDQTLNPNNRGTGYAHISNVQVSGTGGGIYSGGIGIECITCLEETIESSLISGWHIGIDQSAWFGANALFRSNANLFLRNNITNNYAGIVSERQALDDGTWIGNVLENNNIGALAFNSHLSLTLMNNHFEMGSGGSTGNNPFGCSVPDGAAQGLIVCGGYDNHINLFGNNFSGYYPYHDIWMDNNTTSIDIVNLHDDTLDPGGLRPSAGGGFFTGYYGGSITLYQNVNAPQTIQATTGVPQSGTCGAGSLALNRGATSASTVLYVCYPNGTWNAVSVP